MVQKKMIKNLRVSGMSLREIAEKFKICRKEVERILKIEEAPVIKKTVQPTTSAKKVTATKKVPTKQRK